MSGPIIDAANLLKRYFSSSPPCAAAMGPEGAILCHVLYAWATSYGVDENGQLDVPEGGGEPVGQLDPLAVSDGEVKRERDRQTRKTKMAAVVQVILKEIDDCGVMRKPTWDGVRCLLLILPLTDGESVMILLIIGIASPVERLAMYECGVSQSFTLCTFGATGYDGQPSATSGVNGGDDDEVTQSVRVRIYWCRCQSWAS
jgi:hypothetical protein